MPLIERFEDIQAWHEARQLTKMIYTLTRKADFEKDFGLKDQIRRVSVSIMANIAEGFDCDSEIEFAHFLSYARRSAVEVQSHLYTALDANYISQEDFDLYYEQARKAKALAGAFRHSILKSTHTNNPITCHLNT